jgi:type IV pilus assembly protein PilY1
VETNCKQYGTNWKPEGLIQQYADRMRFSAFGYMNQQDGNSRDGGVLRARQKFVGPTQPVPGLPATTNPKAEWSSTTGVFQLNPDAADATTTNTIFGPSPSVTNSGVTNYLNKFGEINPGNYRSNDPVSELYYAALRYFRNLGNVPEWSNIAAGTSAATISTRLDGFPVITTWDDPVQYSCQRNFILGIGDVYTHADKNVPGNQNNTNEPAMPAAVTADTAVNAVTATNKVGVMEGLGNSYGTTYNINGCCSTNSGRMAGLAYWANTQDIRPDVSGDAKTTGKQTVQTYWVDVLEKPFSPSNQFYLAAKYGGFTVPADYDFNRTTALPKSWWATTADTVGPSTGNVYQDRPDNYFTAGRPDQMVAGLNKVFASIASQLRAYTTSFALPSPQVETAGASSFSSQYDSSTWTGEVTGTTVVLDATTGQPTTSSPWVFSEKLATQLAGTGWNTNRRVVTRNTATNAAVPFRIGNLAPAQVTALNTTYRDGDDSADYLNYLRGDQTYETSSATSTNRFYRTRTSLVGDIVGSKARPIGPPSVALSDGLNPGYGTFKAAKAGRATMVYVGTNAGVMHAIVGVKSTTSAANGTELFAYVPSALFQGPTATPNVNGLAALGNPSFLHHYYVNATPQVYDVDLNRTGGNTGGNMSGAPDWRSVLIGGLGKGGRAYYAIDVTDPESMTTEAAVAGKVLWEFTDPDLGYTFGEPALIKTAKYGWVVVLVSGYNNTDGRGYFFFVNPRTGALLEKVSTGVGSPTESAGLAHVNTFVNSVRDGTADAAYAGDLLGNVWRVDLTKTTGSYDSPTLIAKLTDASNNPQPITSRPRIEIENVGLPPLWKAKRSVLFGTGRLLDETDIGSTQNQAFYSIPDGTGVAFNTSTADFPIRRGTMTANSNLSTGVKDATGWYIDLGLGNLNLGWRVVSEASIFKTSDLAAFAALLPNGDACNPAGFSRIYAVNYNTGASVLTSGTSNTIIDYAQVNGAVTDIQFINQRTSSGGTTPRLIVGTDQGELKSLPGNFSKGPSRRVLNWRELKVTN